VAKSTHDPGSGTAVAEELVDGSALIWASIEECGLWPAGFTLNVVFPKATVRSEGPFTVLKVCVMLVGASNVIRTSPCPVALIFPESAAV